MPSRSTDPPYPRLDFAVFCEERRAELTRAIARRAARHGLDPDDIVQRTLLRAQAQYEQFATADELLAWCTTVARNLIIDDTRAGYRKREQPHPQPDAATPHSQLPNAEDQAIDRADLDRVMAKLPPSYRKVLRLDADGHSYEEIAAAFGTTTAAAGMLLQRARRAARKAMGPLVAALLPLGVSARRLQHASAGATQAFVVGVVGVSLVVALVVPGASAGSSGATERRNVDTTSPLAASPTKPTVIERLASKATPAATSAAPVAVARPPAVKSDASNVLPHVPPTCTSGVCVGSGCSASDQAGDALYVKADGPCGVGTTEAETPVCQYVVDNPVIGCQRRGKPQWKVDPPPPPSPEGAPL